MTTDGINELFDLSGRVAVITGGAGLLGRQHACAIARAGGRPVILDVSGQGIDLALKELNDSFGCNAFGIPVDITRSAEVEGALEQVRQRTGRVDILINNAANNPKVESATDIPWSRLENFPIEVWNKDIEVGLTGAFLCSKVFGSEMARRGGGVIINIASDLAVIAPDQRLYRQQGLPEHRQPAKPVSYSVVKTGLLGLTRYLATYWAEANVRVNAISPGGVYNGQPEEFVARLKQLIPLARMAKLSEYQGAILFLCSDASSYMTGTNLVIDGGRSCW